MGKLDDLLSAVSRSAPESKYDGGSVAPAGGALVLHADARQGMQHLRRAEADQ
jgi:hypothetical protein